MTSDVGSMLTIVASQADGTDTHINVDTDLGFYTNPKLRQDYTCLTLFVPRQGTLEMLATR